MSETIALLEKAGQMGLRDRVARVFRTRDSAFKWMASLDRNVRVVVLEGRWKVGQELRCDTPKRNIHDGVPPGRVGLTSRTAQIGE
jgi:hypothetical protein